MKKNKARTGRRTGGTAAPGSDVEQADESVHADADPAPEEDVMIPDKAEEPLPSDEVVSELDPLWREYLASRSLEARNQLVERYMWQVREAAERLSAKFPAMVTAEDLHSWGSEGLINAIEKFEPERGYKFETFSTYRIRGQMLDELRRYDWVPRMIRLKKKRVEQKREELETGLQRNVTDEEMAEAMEMSLADYEKLQQEVDVKSMVSLDRKWDEGGDNEMSHLDSLTDFQAKDPTEDLQRAEIKELALRGLSKTEKEILVMYYYEGMKQKEIGAALDISESRVCQIHQKTLDLLREKFESRGLSSSL